MSEVPSEALPAYRSATGRARTAAAALAAFVLVQVLTVVADGGRIAITNRLIGGGEVSDAEATSSDDLVRLAAILGIAAMGVCAALFLLWLHRAVANGPALGGRDLRYTPGWAVGWWFVPILNLVRPFQVVAEAWGVSGGEGSGPGVLLPAWWGLFILGSVVSRFVLVQSGGSDLTSLRNAAVVDVVASVLLALAAMLCMLLVRRLTGRQEARHLELASAAPVPQPA